MNSPGWPIACIRCTPSRLDRPFQERKMLRTAKQQEITQASSRCRVCNASTASRWVWYGSISGYSSRMVGAPWYGSARLELQCGGEVARRRAAGGDHRGVAQFQAGQLLQAEPAGDETQDRAGVVEGVVDEALFRVGRHDDRQIGRARSPAVAS